MEQNLFQIGGLIAFIATVFITILLLKAHLNDAPDRDSKIHKDNKASAGGIAIITGFAFSIYYLMHYYNVLDSNIILFLFIIPCALGFIGLIDDIFILGAKFRLVLSIIISFLLYFTQFNIDKLNIGFGIILNIGPIIGIIFLMIWLIYCINASNFMDGANGLSIGISAISILMLSVLFYFKNMPDIALIGFVLFCATIGFLIYNIVQGSIFAGDVGSYFMGAFYACFAIIAIKNNISIYTIICIYMLILFDVFSTLIYRIKNKHNLLLPHKLHIYQTLILRGNSHFNIASKYWIVTIIASIISIFIDIYYNDYAGLFFLGYFGLLIIINKKYFSLRGQ